MRGIVAGPYHRQTLREAGEPDTRLKGATDITPRTLKKDREDIVKIAFVLYDGVTLLDFAGAFDPLTRLKSMRFMPDIECQVCGRTEQIRSSEGIELGIDTVSPDLSSYDYVVIPGGDGVMELIKDKAFLSWLAKPSEITTVVAVCGGVLLIGAAGMLRDRRATTHPGLQEVLERFAREVSSDRIVEDGHVITAGGVTAAIDLGLYLSEKIAGREVREKIQKQMDYTHYPQKNLPAPVQ